MTNPPPSRLLTAATARLAAAGVPSPRVDAELLLAHVLGIGRGSLVAADPASGAQRAAFDAAITRRESREPLQHIIGTAPFGFLEVPVGPGVFVPRPETELRAEWAIAQAEVGDTAVDLCAGSGALGIYFAAKVAASRVAFVERDETAVRYLRHTIGPPSDEKPVLQRDVRDPDLPAQIEAAVGRVTVVLCNPPYIPEGAELAPEAAADPHDALFSGPDGLDLIRQIAPLSAHLLRSGGVVAIEHDDSNGAGTIEALRAAGFTQLIQHRDLAGRPRFVTGRIEQ